MSKKGVVMDSNTALTTTYIASYEEVSIPKEGETSCKIRGIGGDGWTYDIGGGRVDTTGTCTASIPA